MNSIGRTPDAERSRHRFVVWDRQLSRVYVELPTAKSMRAAQRELRDMLRYHARDSEWRERLCIPD